jgi:hypothetical protein
MNKQFYSYLYLREDGTPYYAGKGQGKRAFKKQSGIRPPKDKSRIVILPMENEVLAFESEIALIQLFGRRDNETGILRNRTDGGQGISNPSADVIATRRATGLSMIERKIGIFSRTAEQRVADTSKGSLAAGHKHKRDKTGIFRLTPEQRTENGLLGGSIGTGGKATNATTSGRKANGGKSAVKNGTGIFAEGYDKGTGGRIGGLVQGQRNAESGLLTFALHTRWHVKRNISNPACTLCIAA